MKKVDKTQERYLLLMTNAHELSSEELLDLIKEISLHQRCLNFLMAEVDKCLNGLSPNIMDDVLTVQNTGATLDTITFCG